MVRAAMLFVVIWMLSSIWIYWMKFELKNSDWIYVVKVLLFGLITAVVSVGIIAFIVALF